ncbi:MAG: aldo/keto reductase [Candidatus Acetothermia bacterium]
MTEVPEVELNTGSMMPMVGFGTWDLREKTTSSVANALDLGYTHIDAAEGYLNEDQVGKALKGYDREDLFITSKVLPGNLNYGSVVDACNRSLDKLGTPYLDLYLIHWPNLAISLRETLHAFKKLYDLGKVRNVGVSNFSIYELKIARRISETPISVNQVQFHPWYHDEELLSYCKEQGIQLTAAAPFARTAVFDDPLIVELAKKYDKTPAQMVLRWSLQKGVVTVPRSSSREHIEENLQIFDFQLEDSAIKKIDEIPREQGCDYEISLDDEVFGIPS